MHTTFKDATADISNIDRRTNFDVLALANENGLTIAHLLAIKGHEFDPHEDKDILMLTDKDGVAVIDITNWTDYWFIDQIRRYERELSKVLKQYRNLRSIDKLVALKNLKNHNVECKNLGKIKSLINALEGK